MKAPRLVGVGVIVAATAVIAASAVHALVAAPPAPAARVVAGAIAMLGLVLATASTLDRPRERARPRLLFALVAQILLALLQIDVQRGMGFLVVMPTIAMIILAGSVRGAVATIALATADVVQTRLRDGEPLPSTVAATVGFVSASLFVVAFSLILMRERDARARIQELAADVAELAAARERNRDALLKHGDVAAARVVFKDAQLVPDYASWPYKAEIEARLASDLAARAAQFDDPDPKKQPPIGFRARRLHRLPRHRRPEVIRGARREEDAAAPRLRGFVTVSSRIG